MCILLNFLLCLFSNVRVPLVDEFPVGMKHFLMLFGGVGTPPALHRGVENICCLSYDLFRHTRSYGRDIPVGILGASQGGER